MSTAALLFVRPSPRHAKQARRRRIERALKTELILDSIGPQKPERKRESSNTFRTQGELTR